MSDDHRPDVDFVIGPDHGDGDRDELLDTGEPKRTDRRPVIGLIVAALVVVGVVVAVRGHSTRPSATRTSSATSAPSPVLPSWAPATPDREQIVRFTTVQLNANLCVTGRTCFAITTTRSARAKISAAIVKAFGGVSDLRIRDSAIALDDPPRKSLFARDITAHTPNGRVHVLAAAVGANSILVQRTAPGTIQTDTAVGDYALAATVTKRPDRSVAQPGGRLQDLVNDPRLTARS